MPTGKTTKRAAAASAPFRAADHLRTDAEIAAYIESMLADGDARAVPVALRTVADAIGVWLRSPKGPACLAKLSIGHFQRVAIRALTRWR